MSRTVRLYRMTVITLMNYLRRRGWFGGDSWAAWRVVLKALFALPMDDAERQTFAEIAGQRQPPTRPVREAWFIVGRRGGKSLIAALLGLFFATCVRYQLAPGEKGVVMIVAADRRQGRVIFRYLQAFFAIAPFAQLVERQTQEAIFLTNGLVIEIHTASFRSTRGYSVVCFIGDEVAFWSVDGANPDEEILNAIRPAQATQPQAMMIVISSPYARRGALYKAHQRHYGVDSQDVLVIQAPSRTMNPSLPESVVAKAYEDDPAAAAAEYGGEFRNDVESLVRPEVIELCRVPERYELPRVLGVDHLGTVDVSGSGQDDFTAAVGHYELREGHTVAVLDAVRVVAPPFSPEQVVEELAAFFKSYGIAHVIGDAYGGEWPREQFRKHGVEYIVARMPKSGYYRELLPLLNSGRVELLDHKKLLAQLGGLERRVARGGKDSIDHGPGGHDDVINAAAIALVEAACLGARPQFDISGGGAVEPGDDVELSEADLEEMGPAQRMQYGDRTIMRGVQKRGVWFPGD